METAESDLAFNRPRSSFVETHVKTDNRVLAVEKATPE
jgi:hypothetical protein